LEEIALRGASHRDVKPENLFELAGRAFLGDFGLVTAPDVDTITQVGKPVGSKFYIAPEMILSGSTAPGGPVDVYELAKTIWVLLTNQNHPVPGQHLLDVPALTVSAYVDAARLRTIDLLLERMTEYEPDRRPTMSEVVKELRAWLTVRSSGEPSNDLPTVAREFNALLEPARRRAVEDGRRVTLRQSLLQTLDSAVAVLVEDAKAAGVSDVRLTPRGAQDYLVRRPIPQVHVWSDGRGIFFGNSVNRPAGLGRPNSFYLYSGFGVIEWPHERIVLGAGHLLGPNPDTAAAIGNWFYTSEPVLLGSATQDLLIADYLAATREHLGEALGALIEKLNSHGII